MNRFSALFAAFILPYALLASAPANAASDKPVMIVRYNQPKVFYQRQLYNVVSRAVAIKPAVVFNLVSFNPPTLDQAKMARETSALVADMMSVGIPQDRIHVSAQAVPDSTVHEVYLYVD